MEEKMKENNEIKSTAHSKYRCQYHIVFAPKFRRKEIYGQLRKDIGEILRKLCEQKGVEIIEAEACPDHIHMLVSIPPYLSIAQFMGYLKGKSSLMIFDRHANLKYKYGSRNFWCRGYYVDTVGRNKKVIAEYIRNQLEEDYTLDQMSIKEYVNFQRNFDIESNPEQYYEALKAFNKYVCLLRGTIRKCNQKKCSVEKLLAVTEQLFDCDDRQGFDEILKTLNPESAE